MEAILAVFDAVDVNLASLYTLLVGMGLYWEVFWLVAFWKLRFRAAVEGGVVSAKAGCKMFMVMVVVVWVVCRSYKDESQ